MGRNDNPNAVEFSSSFKKLLVCHPLITSADHNVLTNATGILNVSSNRKAQPVPPVPPVVEHEVIELDLDYETVVLEEIETSDAYKQHSWAYIALCVEENFIKNTKSHKYNCKECANILISGEDKINDELLAMRDKNVGKIHQPSSSTLKIVIFGSAIMKLFSEVNHSKNSMNVVCNNITKNINCEDLYNEHDFSHCGLEASSHKEEFINLIIKTYAALKSHRICKKITDEEKGELIRYKNKRAVILAGQ